jgi:DNA-binding MarR family transcriptional regulator
MFDLDACVAFVANKEAKKLADAFNERLIAKGITRVQWIALYYIGKHESLNQNELAEKMNIQNSSVARLLDRLERDGYIKRVKDAADRRITNVLLTEDGKKLREKLLPEGEKMSQVFSKGISNEEIKIFLEVFKKMVENSRE